MSLKLYWGVIVMIGVAQIAYATGYCEDEGDGCSGIYNYTMQTLQCTPNGCDVGFTCSEKATGWPGVGSVSSCVCWNIFGAHGQPECDVGWRETSQGFSLLCGYRPCQNGQCDGDFITFEEQLMFLCCCQ